MFTFFQWLWLKLQQKAFFEQIIELIKKITMVHLGPMQALNPQAMYYEGEALPMRQNGWAKFAVQSSSFDWKFHTHGLEETSGEYGHPITLHSAALRSAPSLVVNQCFTRSNHFPMFPPSPHIIGTMVPLVDGLYTRFYESIVKNGLVTILTDSGGICYNI